MRRLHLLFGLACVAGCTAQIDQLRGPASGSDQSGAAATPGSDQGDEDGKDPSKGDADEEIPIDPGHVAMRRLNRSEYNRTVHDLLGTNTTPADDFPADDVSFGFDTVGDVLSISPLHLELYDAAAQRLVAELFARDATDPVRVKLLNCTSGDADACAQDVIERLATRAFRRPVETDELSRISAVRTKARAAGASADEALQLALQAVLVSPHFMFRVEHDENPGSVDKHAVAPYELASRLSYFLWGSMPDDALFAAAADGSLATAKGLRTEAERMLDDPRSAALTSDFAGQWLFTRAIDGHDVDAEAFPEYDAELRASMVEETHRFFSAFLTEDRPFAELLTADFTFVDERLARHYGLPVPATAFERVSLAGTPRRGLLGQAALLTLTSVPTRTSPVKRGKWVLDQLLCSPLPPPPPDVLPLDEEDASGLPLRERLAQHRKNPVCAGCHNSMDPIGLGLESFDAIGRFREREAGTAIDSSGTLPDGKTFDGATELVGLLSGDERFAHCLTKQLLVFGLGREIGRNDDGGFIDLILKQTDEDGGSLRDLLLSIIESDLFRMRRGLDAAGVKP